MADFDEGIKLYKKRWCILSLYVLYAAVTGVPWVQYSVISDLVIKYYGVSARAVDWTSMIMMGLYPVMLLPGTYIMDKLDLRSTALIGVGGICVSTWIKVFSSNSHLFWVTFIGQVVAALIQIFVLGLPPALAAVWFGENELSTACGIGIFGQQLGAAMSFIVPPMFVRDHPDLEVLGRDFSTMHYSFAGISTVSAVLIFLLFDAEPKLPPTRTQRRRLMSVQGFNIKKVVASYKALLRNWGFLLMCFCYAVNVGVMCAICTLLNEIMRTFFKNSTKHAGIIGLLIIVFGMFGTVIFGWLLDRTRKYKETTFIIYFLTLLSTIAFIVSLAVRILYLVYITSCIMGFFMISYYAIAVEMVVELTYPELESTTSSILVSVYEFIGIVFIIISGYMLDTTGTTSVLILFAVLLLFGTICTIFVPNDLRRQAAFTAILK